MSSETKIRKMMSAIIIAQVKKRKWEEENFEMVFTCHKRLRANMKAVESFLGKILKIISRLSVSLNL